MEIVGYILAILIGVSLGLIGGGGSILTVPVLVYIFHIDPTSATAYSLFIVGVTSLAGAAAYMKRGEVAYKTAFLFAIPAFLTVYLTRRFIVPAIPDILFEFSGIVFSRDLMIMIVFAFLMLGASYSMIKKISVKPKVNHGKRDFIFLALQGIIVGFLTGLVGAGGGFMIIPTLVLFANLDMKRAIGTSLMIISANSLIGFMGAFGANMVIDWMFLMLMSGIAVIGIFMGSRMTKFIPGSKLKPAFGWFVLVMGVFIIGKEISKIL
ncbi:MAG: sulfite exporter TauE/SafE family protein [Bacteroidetes bacterium]|nr:sulfite exporter TauE/SafE family protein [Bacteroidota bacterium]